MKNVCYKNCMFPHEDVKPQTHRLTQTQGSGTKAFSVWIFLKGTYNPLSQSVVEATV